jgi:hypothetical protein
VACDAYVNLSDGRLTPWDAGYPSAQMRTLQATAYHTDPEWVPVVVIHSFMSEPVGAGRGQSDEDRENGA